MTPPLHSWFGLSCFINFQFTPPPPHLNRYTSSNRPFIWLDKVQFNLGCIKRKTIKNKTHTNNSPLMHASPPSSSTHYKIPRVPPPPHHAHDLKRVACRYGAVAAAADRNCPRTGSGHLGRYNCYLGGGGVKKGNFFWQQHSTVEYVWSCSSSYRVGGLRHDFNWDFAEEHCLNVFTITNGVNCLIW